MTTAYIAGPMSGYEDFNFPAFHKAAEVLRQFPRYSEVINPAENFDGRQDLDWQTYLRTAIQQVAASDEVVVLEGWEESKGASLEVHIARQLGLPVWEYKEWSGALSLLDPVAYTNVTDDDWVMAEPSILEEANTLVTGPRQESYGHPRDDFAATGRMWGAILTGALGQKIPDVSPHTVALMMVALKLSRESRVPKRDNRVDGAGYLLTADMVVDDAQE